MHRYYAIHKPFGMLSQFHKEGKNKAATLKDLNFNFEKDVYPVGRLDADSEGLLILTNDKRLNHLLLNPQFKHNRTYLAQVDGQIVPEAIKQLEEGVLISTDGVEYNTRPAKAVIVNEPENINERHPPVRFRKNIPTSWVKLILQEGKHRQVRKMTAKVGYPTLRLIRISIEDIELGNMKAGEVKEFEQEIIFNKLKLSVNTP